MRNKVLPDVLPKLGRISVFGEVELSIVGEEEMPASIAPESF